jgi:hypothetical protein
MMRGSWQGVQVVAVGQLEAVVVGVALGQ